MIKREMGDRRSKGNSLFNMALALGCKSNLVAAIARAEAALRIFEEIESPHTERVRSLLAQWRGG